MNLGPASLAQLERIGIFSIEDLRRIGSVAAYLAIKQNWPAASLNLLWALEGALTDRHWHVVAKEDRLHLLTLLEKAQGKSI